jgi:hypothetical protein
MRRKRKQLELFPNLPTVFDPMKPMRFWAHHRQVIKSDRWKEWVREETFKLANYECQRSGPRCQGSLNLQCHHVRYDNLGNETPGVDTACVCGNCHHLIHYPDADNDNEPL